MDSQIDQERSNRYLKTKNARHCCNRLWTYRLSNQSQTFYHSSRKFLYFYIVYKYSTVLIIFEIFLDSQISSLIKLWIGWAETKRLTAWIQRMICRSNTFINYKFRKKHVIFYTKIGLGKILFVYLIVIFFSKYSVEILCELIIHYLILLYLAFLTTLCVTPIRRHKAVQVFWGYVAHESDCICLSIEFRRRESSRERIIPDF